MQIRRKLLLWAAVFLIIFIAIGYFIGAIGAFLLSMMTMLILMLYFLDLVSEGIEISSKYSESRIFQNRFFNYFIVINILGQRNEYQQFCEKLRTVGISWILLFGCNFFGIALWVLTGQ